MMLKYPKDSMYKCPYCERHFIGGLALGRYEGRCNKCDSEISSTDDRVK
jgi:hypothetical protein